MSICIELIDRARWHELAPGFDDLSYRQAWEFGHACATRLGARSEHVAIIEGGRLVGLADVRVKRVPLVGAGIAYVNGGPLVRRGGQGLECLSACLRGLIEHYVHRRGLVLRVLPPVRDPASIAAQKDVFAEMGFVPAETPEPYRTMLVSLEPPLEQIRKQLAQKWRNGLNRAERNGLAVRSGTGEALFEEFCRLYAELLDRKGFDVDLNADFYARVQRDLPEPQRFTVSLVDVDGEPAAGHVASLLGDTCVYLLGASNARGMQSKASYLLQWHAIETARSHGCLWYDLGGIDPDGNPGVYHFKQGLGGIEVTGAGPFEIARGGARRRIVQSCERMYRTVRGLRRREPGRTTSRP